MIWGIGRVPELGFTWLKLVLGRSFEMACTAPPEEEEGGEIAVTSLD